MPAKLDHMKIKLANLSNIGHLINGCIWLVTSIFSQSELKKVF